MCTEWPQMTLNIARPKVSHICCSSTHQVTSFSHFHSTAWRFGVTGHFVDIGTLNDLELTLNTTRSKLHYVCSTSNPESQIWVKRTRPFWDICIEWLQNDLEHCDVKRTPCQLYRYMYLRVPNFKRPFHQMTPKLPWTLRGQRYAMCICFTATPNSQCSLCSVSLY